MAERGLPLRPSFRSKQKLELGNLFWRMEYDLNARALYVYFADGEVEQQTTSADGHYVADIALDNDNIPRVLGLEFLDPLKVGVIEDWIHEAAELALAEYDDNFEKGVMQWNGQQEDDDAL